MLKNLTFLSFMFALVKVDGDGLKMDSEIIEYPIFIILFKIEIFFNIGNPYQNSDRYGLSVPERIFIPNSDLNEFLFSLIAILNTELFKSFKNCNLTNFQIFTKSLFH